MPQTPTGKALYYNYSIAASWQITKQKTAIGQFITLWGKIGGLLPGPTQDERTGS
jgi:hypothetical protein